MKIHKGHHGNCCCGKIRGFGRRITPARHAVLDALSTRGEHLTAEDVFKASSRRYPNIGLATVYRTLAVLKEMGMVKDHALGESHAHFETVPETPHYHFTCQKCGQVVEFDAPQVKQVVHALSEREGLQVTDVHLFLSGYCAKCRTGGTKAKFNI
jgi:Fur family peroxide stress response transcriptional regulator